MINKGFQLQIFISVSYNSPNMKKWKSNEFDLVLNFVTRNSEIPINTRVSIETLIELINNLNE